MPPQPPPPGCTPSGLKITKVYDDSGDSYDNPDGNSRLTLQTGMITVEYTVPDTWGTNAYIENDPPLSISTTTPANSPLPTDPPPPPKKFYWSPYTTVGDTQKIHINADSFQSSGLCHESYEIPIKVVARNPHVKPTLHPIKRPPEKVPEPIATMTFPHDNATAVYSCQFGLLAFGCIVKPPVSMHAVMYSLPNMALPAKTGQLIQTAGATWIVKFDSTNGYTGSVAVVADDLLSGYVMSARFTIVG